MNRVASEVRTRFKKIYGSIKQKAVIHKKLRYVIYIILHPKMELLEVMKFWTKAVKVIPNPWSSNILLRQISTVWWFLDTKIQDSTGFGPRRL